MRVETIGNATLYLGDCRDLVLPILHSDATITDPPYGIDYNPRRFGDAHSKMDGDSSQIDIRFLLSGNKYQIIWGGENFTNLLPKGNWLCWTKRSPRMAAPMAGSDFELAWTNLDTFYRHINIIHGGVINADSGIGNNAPRLHPTQKPIELMRWCIRLLPDECNTIVDPFMGSGTTGIACYKEKKKFVGIEIDKRHFETACERLVRECSQIQLEL